MFNLWCSHWTSGEGLLLILLFLFFFYCLLADFHCEMLVQISLQAFCFYQLYSDKCRRIPAGHKVQFVISPS